MPKITSKSFVLFFILGILVFGLAFYFTYVQERAGQPGAERQSPSTSKVQTEGSARRNYENRPECDGVIYYDMQTALQAKDSVCALVLRDIQAFLVETTQLQNLGELVIRSDVITVLPAQVAELQQLEVLDVAGSENLRAFQADLFTMHNLRWLNIAGTSIKVMPNGIENLSTLEKLAVHQGQFSEQELQALQVKLPNLEIVQLDPQLIFKQ